MLGDNSTVQQVLGCLCLKPQLLSQVDKYNLTVSDFSTRFFRYIYSAIYGLYAQGASKIEPIDIANYLESDSNAKISFEQNHGVEYVQDAKDFSDVQNFDYYYNRLKKINLLRDLSKQGFDISDYYCDDLTSPRATEINQKFETLTTKDICDGVKRKLLHLEADYAKSEEVQVESAFEGMEALINDISENVSVGLPLQGHIYSRVVNGAEPGALYIRSASSGTGKTRSAVADACYLAYPVRFDGRAQQWVQNGSNERVLFIITEQTYSQIRKMILAYLTDINESRFKFSDFGSQERQLIAQALKVMEKYRDNFIIIKMPNPTIELLKMMIRENCLTHNISAVFFDYIFINPALLHEFGGASLRNDEILALVSAALKDLAVELNVPVFTSTQVNAAADDNRNIRNEASLAGGRATINKADNGAIMARPTKDELESLASITATYGIPNIVTDIFKVRSGEWSQVRIWSRFNLGTLKRQDLFITDARLDPIEGFFEGGTIVVQNWDDEKAAEFDKFVRELNDDRLQNNN